MTDELALSTHMALEFPDKIVIAKIDDTPFPYPLLRLPNIKTVDFTIGARESRIHTIDDLIVHLYWLIEGRSRSAALAQRTRSDSQGG